jgi:hypothetical protein
MSQANPIYTFISYLFKIPLNIILASTSRSPKQLFPLHPQFGPTVRIFDQPFLIHTFCPSSSSSLDNHSDTCEGSGKASGEAAMGDREHKVAKIGSEYFK